MSLVSRNPIFGVATRHHSNKGITHVFFSFFLSFLCVTFARFRGSSLSTRPPDKIFKDLPRVPASLNECKSMIVIVAYLSESHQIALKTSLKYKNTNVSFFLALQFSCLHEPAHYNKFLSNLKYTDPHFQR